MNNSRAVKKKSSLKYFVSATPKNKYNQSYLPS